MSALFPLKDKSISTGTNFQEQGSVWNETKQKVTQSSATMKQPVQSLQLSSQSNISIGNQYTAS